MSDRVPPIARVPLARSIPRLFLLPTLLLLTGAATFAFGLTSADSGAALALAAGIGQGLTGLAWAGWLLSIRLDVEEAAIRVGWLGGERIYILVPGPVTRVRLRGTGSSKLRSGARILPWQLGGARLRDEEEVEVVRLAPTATAILVPTERGRLAIAAADEEVLLDALSRAARARQRLEELARPAPPVEEPEPVASVDVPPTPMTGIERAVFEERMARERAAAVEVAEQERAAAATEPAESSDAAALPADTGRRPFGRLRGRRAERVALPILRPSPSAILIILPLFGAGMAWGVGVLLGRMPEPGSDLGRLTALALVLAGPATTVGAIMARIWWPRLVAVVVAGGLTTALFVGRALIGG